MPPSSSANNTQAISHDINPSPSPHLAPSCPPKNHQSTNKKLESSKTNASSYVSKKKKNKKKPPVPSSTDKSEGSIIQSKSVHNQPSTVSDHDLDQALENNLRKERQKKQRRQHFHHHPQRQQVKADVVVGKNNDHSREDSSVISSPASPSTKVLENKPAVKWNRKHSKSKKAATSTIDSKTSVSNTEKSKKPPSKSSADDSKLSQENSKQNEEKDLRGMQSNRSVSAVSSKGRKNKMKNMSGESSTNHSSSKIGNSPLKDQVERGKITSTVVSSRGADTSALTEGNQPSRTSTCKSTESHYKKKKHPMNQVQTNSSNSKQTNEKKSQQPHLSRDLQFRNHHSNDSNSSNNANQHRQRRSRFFQKKRNISQKRIKFPHENDHAEEEHDQRSTTQQQQQQQHQQQQQSPSTSQRLEEHGQAGVKSDEISETRQHLQSQDTQNKTKNTLNALSEKLKPDGDFHMKQKGLQEEKLDEGGASDQDKKFHNTAGLSDDTVSVEGHLSAIGSAVKNIQLEESIDEPISNEKIDSTVVTTTSFKRSTSNHSSVSSMENNTTITMTTTATDMTANFPERSTNMMPNFHGNYGRRSSDENNPYNPDYVNSQNLCAMMPNPNDPNMMSSFGIQMSYPVPYQYPMNSPVPVIPPEYNFPQDHNYAQADDRNDIMMGPSNQVYDNAADASYRVPFYPNEYDMHFPSRYNPMPTNSIMNNVENPAGNLHGMSHDDIESRGEIGPRPNIMPPHSPNMTLMPPPPVGGIPPYYFGANFQPQLQPVYMEQPFNMSVSQPPQFVPNAMQNQVPPSHENDNEDDESNKAGSLNVQAPSFEPTQSSCSEQ